MRVLVLGGTTEASELARLLARAPRFRATLSLAGRTRTPVPQPIPCRVGGFGGASGLAAHLRSERIGALIDATHPFAAQMTRHAVQAARETQTPLLVVLRPEWQQRPDDHWQVVPNMEAAAAALGSASKRVLLTIGQQDLDPFMTGPPHSYLIRSVDPPAIAPEGAAVITARGPFAEDDERALLQQHQIEILVTKNSGGTATRPKLDAARARGIPVIMVSRPAPPHGVEIAATAQEAMAWLDAHEAVLRGE